MADFTKSLVGFFHKMQQYFNHLFLTFKGNNEQQNTENTQSLKSTHTLLVHSMNKQSHEKVSILHQAVDGARSLFGKLFDSKKEAVKKETPQPKISNNNSTIFASSYNYDLLKPLRYSSSILDYMKFKR